MGEADLVSKGAKADPSAERGLVDWAKGHDFKRTRSRVDRVRRGVHDAKAEADRAEAVRRSRRWRQFSDPEDGSPRVDAKFVPGEFAEAKAVLDAFHERIFREARQAVLRESAEAYGADAFIAAMAAAGTTIGIRPRVRPTPPPDTDPGPTDPTNPTNRGPFDPDPTGSGAASDAPDAPDPTDQSDRSDRSDPWGSSAASPAATAADEGVSGGASRPGTGLGPPCVLVDAIALQRGFVAPGETCEIPGVGPVDLDWARRLLGDTLVDVIVHNGVDITTYASTSRYVPRPVRVAIHVRDRGCTRPDCDREWHLERDHDDDFARSRDTSYRNLKHFCGEDHDAKTHRGARLERHGDEWWWYPPPDRAGVRDPNAAPLEPERGPVGRHLTPWNLDHLPDPDDPDAVERPDEPDRPGGGEPPRLDFGPGP